MQNLSRTIQRGQAIVLVALMILVLFGFVGLAIDGGRAYLDRRHLQAAVDAAALAAAYKYMNTSDYSQSEQTAAQTYASNEALYGTVTCAGLGTVAASCTFSDPWGQVLGINVTNRAIAGVSFAVTATHSMPVAIMQVLGSAATINVSATATAMARRAGTNGAAILTLAPNGCGGSAGQSLTFQGNSKTYVTGDIWSNGSIFDNSGAAGGSVNGNVIDKCGTPPALNTPAPWTVTGTQANGWTMPDPAYPMPALNATSQSWNTASGSVENPGTYAADPGITGHNCYFLAGGVYDFTAGFTLHGGFVSNELRPPDEPNLTASATALSGTITSIPVGALTAAVPGSSTVTVAGQAFTVSSAGAASGATSIPVASAAVTGTIAAGTTVVTMARATNQFWNSNGVGCDSSFSVTPLGNTGLSSGTYSVEVTAVRWEPTTGSTCTGPATPTCFERESSPSMCRTVALASSGNIKVAVTSDPGATDFNVYVAQNGLCTGLSWCAHTGNGNSSVLINSCATGQPAPPDPGRPPLASSLPDTDPPAGVPPGGDLANENHCADPSTGNNVACPAAWTPGAVVFFLPSGGCLDLNGQGDVYLFSGYQYQRVVLFEPGPEQSSQPNTCSANKVNGAGFTSLIGIIYMPAASVTINGNNSYQATIAGGLIAWTVSVIGTAKVAIIADPTLRAWPPAVQLTQ